MIKDVGDQVIRSGDRGRGCIGVAVSACSLKCPEEITLIHLRCQVYFLFTVGGTDFVMITNPLEYPLEDFLLVECNAQPDCN